MSRAVYGDPGEVSATVPGCSCIQSIPDWAGKGPLGSSMALLLSGCLWATAVISPVALSSGIQDLSSRRSLSTAKPFMYPWGLWSRRQGVGPLLLSVPPGRGQQHGNQGHNCCCWFWWDISGYPLGPVPLSLFQKDGCSKPMAQPLKTYW